jgi:hypothetical protein
MATSKKPIYFQRIEQALDIRPFMKEAENILNKNCDSDDSDENDLQKRPTFEEKANMFNEPNDERKWLFNLLLSETETESEISDEDKYVGEMLRDHVRQKKLREQYHQNPNVMNNL